MKVQILIFSILLGCQGVKEPDTVTVEQPPIKKEKTCDGSPLGSTRTENCRPGQRGEILYVCDVNGWNRAIDSCEALPDKCEEATRDAITWDRHIQPIVSKDCLGCHSSPLRFDSFQVVAASGFDLAQQFVDRVNLDAANSRVMPPRPTPPLSDDDRRLFRDWEIGGFLENNECLEEDPSGNPFLLQTLNQIGRSQLNDIQQIPSNDQKFTRYLALSHKYNTRDRVADMTAYNTAVQKSLNSLSFSQEIFPAQTIDERKTQLRIDLRNYDLTPNDWELILRVEPFDLVDDTSIGRIIQQLTGTSQPMLHADNFIFTAFGDPRVYNALMAVPQNVNDLYRRIGVDYFGDIANFDSVWLGFNGSSIADDNRVLSRHESNSGPNNRGWMWQTYDTNDDFVPEKNFFQNPCPPGANCQAEFVYDAGEIIYTLPNGLLAYALYNGVGVRQEEAPVDVVVDNQSPFDPIIENGLDCARCHGLGLIPNRDQIRNSVLQNASEFNAVDVDIIKELFSGDVATNAQFIRDNTLYANAINAIGGSIFQDDPMNFFTDKHRDDLLLEDAAAFVFFSPEKFRQELSESQDARKQIGSLLSGGTITFDQFVEVFPILVKDFRLGLDNLDEQ